MCRHKVLLLLHMLSLSRRRRFLPSFFAYDYRATPGLHHTLGPGGSRYLRLRNEVIDSMVGFRYLSWGQPGKTVQE
ncbi:hypothetical protein BX600DRAFT_105143 [Xylariales sp. PMI_506]|nr:hypothetical protein BX600DRAFT_105143 [Xylariales sp. PMI_506]